MITKSLLIDFRKCPYLFFRNHQEKTVKIDKERSAFKNEIIDFFFKDVKEAKSDSFNLNLLDLKEEKALRNFPVTSKNFFANIHILKRESSGYELFEIVPKAIMKNSVYDAIAFKYLLLSNNSIAPAKCYAIKIAYEYTYDDEDTFFEKTEMVDVTKDVLKRLPFVKKDGAKILKTEESPQKHLTSKCFRPYECSRFKECWGEIEEDSVLTLSGMPINLKLDLLKQGKTSITEIKEEKLSAHQMVQKESLKTPHIETEKIEKFLEPLGEEIYFLDFESHQPIMPMFKEMKSYEPIVFQYSIHKLKNGTLSHYEYFGNVLEEDIREKIVLDLIRIIPKDKKVLVYGAPFERRIIKDLAHNYSEHEKDLEEIYKNIVDLNTPFKHFHCYFPSMRGKHSLKAVLPAVDKDLYKDLEVCNGQELIDEYKEYLFSDEKTKSEIKNRLLQYCKTDTLALVKIYQKLLSFCH